jgi:putative Holliday junction resolvase
MKLIALDVGDRRIGIATSDPLGFSVRPLRVLPRKNQRNDIEEVLHTAAQEQAEGLVVGLPLSLDGTLGPQAERVERFRSALQAASPLPVFSWDERFTTAEADRLMLEAGLPAAKRRALRDAAAAAVILRAFLDAHRATA